MKQIGVTSSAEVIASKLLHRSVLDTINPPSFYSTASDTFTATSSSLSHSCKNKFKYKLNLIEETSAGKCVLLLIITKLLPSVSLCITMSILDLIIPNELRTHNCNNVFSFPDHKISITNKKQKCIHCIDKNFVSKITTKIKEKRLRLTYDSAIFSILCKQQLLLNVFIIILMLLMRVTSCHARLQGSSDSFAHGSNASSSSHARFETNSTTANFSTSDKVNDSTSELSFGVADQYLDILDNLERNVAAVIIKVAYGTTSTTKRSIPDNTYLPSLTTVATPPLTTLRYLEKTLPEQKINVRQRSYELDLERDHALPTSAPNADILKSNSNPNYPNPNRHNNHDGERHRNIPNSSPPPSLSSILKNRHSGPSSGIPVYPGDMPSYLPPARSFFTPPLPPEYQNPFADKPTLRGTNNEGIVASTGNYINRRPIPPPSLMPGHERIPLRPPELSGTPSSGSEAVSFGNKPPNPDTYQSTRAQQVNPESVQKIVSNVDLDRKKALNTPSRNRDLSESAGRQEAATQVSHGGGKLAENQSTSGTLSARQEVLPSIRRILSGSNGKKGEVPTVLLKQVTSRPFFNNNQTPSSSGVLIDSTPQENISENFGSGPIAISNINKSKSTSKNNNLDSSADEGQKDIPKTKMSTRPTEMPNDSSYQLNYGFRTTPSPMKEVSEVAKAFSTTSATNLKTSLPNNSGTSASSSSSSRAAAAAAHATWVVAWNVHIYLSVVLFTILGVYSFYKILTYNKLTHLFSQSYFICIHIILMVICSSRIFYLCYDAYNIHSTFHVFVSEILLNLPATFLTISFSVLILFLFLKSLNHKNNRYSALIRPLTVVVGCGVHVVLCITLHYVESYTMQNHQQSLYYQQQLHRRQQAQQQVTAATTNRNALISSAGLQIGAIAIVTPPPRVLSLICQIIYIFICLSLGFLYLYIYRILKRILRSKSQNYIHGFQNLSYAIHITIATALLFVLLAALQIFGAVSISITRPLIKQSSAEMDWLQWGYQFSLRLIEIAIVTLMSWVAGLKTSGGMDASVNVACGVGVASDDNTVVFDTSNISSRREKHLHHYPHNHQNVAGFFLPCTSSSSQEQFESDYPVVCNANTNLHTYTMRTGTLIYDDSFALNSLGNTGQSISTGAVCNTEFQMQQSNYQQPYDTDSVHDSGKNIITPNNYYHHHDQQYGGYLTDATTDHYENPNFELRDCNSSAKISAMKKLKAQTLITATTASCSGGSASGTSATSQQQILFMQSDTCYSEPVQHHGTTKYELADFERPKFRGSRCGSAGKALHINCSDQYNPSAKSRENKHCTNLERATYENPDRRSLNSTHSCSSRGDRFMKYNSFEIHPNDVGMRRSASNNIAGNGIPNCNFSPSGTTQLSAQRSSGVQTLASTDRHHLQQQQINQCGDLNITRGVEFDSNCDDSEHNVDTRNEFNAVNSSPERNSSYSLQKQHQALQFLQHNSDDDMMLVACNAEHTNLHSNDNDTCGKNKPSTADPGKPSSTIAMNGNYHFSKPLIFISPSKNKIQQQLVGLSKNTTVTGIDPIASPVSDSLIESDSSVTDTANNFLHFQSVEDVINAEVFNINTASKRIQKVAPTAKELGVVKNSCS